MAQAEDEDIKDCGNEEDDKDCQGCHEGGLGKRQWVGCLAKLALKRFCNMDTEATPVDIENIPQVRAGSVWYEDGIIHQALHCHVQAVGLDQDLKILREKNQKIVETHLSEDKDDSFDEGERVEALYERSATPGENPEIYLQSREA